MHFRESIASAKLLTEKLYRRNPRELKKSDVPTPEAGVARAFDPERAWRFTELSNQRGIDALAIAFRADFTGDRVFAFGVGIGSMIAQAYNDKSQFYITDSLDAQRLYNAARNLEIAAWKLANAKGPNGELLLLSNEIGPGPCQLVVRAGIRQADRLPGHARARDGATDESHDPPRFPRFRDGGVPAAVTPTPDQAGATMTRTPARFRLAASRFGGAASDTSASMSESAHTRSNWTWSYFERSTSRIVSVRSLRHRALDRAALRIGVGHAVGRDPAGADERLVRLEPAEVVHRVRAVRAFLARDIVARAQQRPAVGIRAQRPGHREAVGDDREVQLSRRQRLREDARRRAAVDHQCIAGLDEARGRASDRRALDGVRPAPHADPGLVDERSAGAAPIRALERPALPPIRRDRGAPFRW